MQTVRHNYKNISPIFDMIERLYTDVSEPLNSNKSLIDISYPLYFKPLCDTLKENIPYYELPKFTENVNYPAIDALSLNKTMIVCVSGGKDSTAVLLYYKKLGYNVIAYHLHGINKVYYDEFVNAEKVCEYLDIPYIIDDIQLCGTHSFYEHPLKNFIIANAAIHFGIREHLSTNIAFGNFYNSKIKDVAFDVCGGDCRDMWDLYEGIINHVIPDFTIYTPLESNKDTFNILDDRPELYRISSSCISPYRFKKSWRDRTETTYKVQISEGRCGCCWKDAMEYIYLADRHMAEYNERYYIHCLEILANTVQKEMGENVLSMQDVWSAYMPYSSSKSKERKIVEHGTYQGRKIKCTE